MTGKRTLGPNVAPDQLELSVSVDVRSAGDFPPEVLSWFLVAVRSALTDAVIADVGWIYWDAEGPPPFSCSADIDEESLFTVYAQELMGAVDCCGAYCLFAFDHQGQRCFTMITAPGSCDASFVFDPSGRLLFRIDTGNPAVSPLALRLEALGPVAWGSTARKSLPWRP